MILFPHVSPEEAARAAADLGLDPMQAINHVRSRKMAAAAAAEAREVAAMRARLSWAATPRGETFGEGESS